jgi:hypothetical protein
MVRNFYSVRGIVLSPLKEAVVLELEVVVIQFIDAR